MAAKATDMRERMPVTALAKLELEGLSVPRASDILAKRLRETILSGGLAVGASLPPERLLVEQSGLSRAAVREALRILEAEGLLTIKPGRGGGSFVRRPGAEEVSRSLNLMIRGQQIRFEDLLAAREGIEPQAAWQAALNRTPEDLEQLEQETLRCSESFGDLDLFLRANVAWHLAVVRASHNPLFVAFMESISAAVHAATDIKDFNPLEVRHLVVRAHQRVFDAIRESDAEAAKRRMGRHVGAYAEAMSDVDAERLMTPQSGDAS